MKRSLIFALRAGTCRQLVLKLTDGTYHRANFTFKS
jgi:hypothetical protein